MELVEIVSALETSKRERGECSSVFFVFSFYFLYDMLSMPLLHGIIITWKRTWSQNLKGINATVPRSIYADILFALSFFFGKLNGRVLVGCKPGTLRSRYITSSIRCATARRFPPHLTSLPPRQALLRNLHAFTTRARSSAPNIPRYPRNTER